MSGLTKTNIDRGINKFLSESTRKVYGGITDQTIDERKQEHVNTNDPKGSNENMKIEKLTTITITDLDRDGALVKWAEMYLINTLSEKFKKKCLNDRNKDGSIAQRGGAGAHYSVGKQYKIYIMYEE
jgi:hypothetical protein